MPRVARQCRKSLYYHIMVQGINREYIFDNNMYKSIYLKLIYENLEKFDISIIAYCVMSNHTHLILKCNDISKISKFMHDVNLKFAFIYNKDKNRVGYVFRDRFKAEPILDLYYLLNCIKYVHMNPVKAKICVSQSDYYFSSYNNHKNKTFLDDTLYLEIFKNDKNWEYVVSNDITFDNDFLEEKFSLDEARKWLELFSDNFKNDYQQNDFKSKMIKGLYIECKLSIKEIEELTKISHYHIKKLIEEK